MTFPSVRSFAITNGTTASATAVVNLPAIIVPGDTIYVVFRCAVAGAVTWPDGTWNEQFDASADAADDQMAAAWREATGTEGSTITLANGNGKFAALAFCVRDAIDPSTQAPELSTVATGSATEPNATTCTPTGGAKDYLWITFWGMEGEQTGITAYPASYTLSQTGLANSGTAGVATTNVTMAGAARQLNAASEDAGVWDVTGTLDDWTAYTVAFHPAAHDPPPVNTNHDTKFSVQTAWIPIVGSLLWQSLITPATAVAAQPARRVDQVAIARQWETTPEPIHAKWLNPSLIAVPEDQPPPLSRDRVSLILHAWTVPDPLRLTREGVPREQAVESGPTSSVAHRAQVAIAHAWVPADPSPRVGVRLPVSVDSPPGGRPLWPQIWPSWRVEAETQQRGRVGVPTDAVVVFDPSDRRAVDAGIRQAWDLDPPHPIVRRTLPVSVTAVAEDPPPPGARGRSTIPIGLVWSVDPVVEITSFLYVPATVDAPLGSRRWLPGVLAAWQTVPPDPQGKPKLAPAHLAVPVDDPPVRTRAWVSTVVGAWTPPQPASIILTKLVPGAVAETPPRLAREPLALRSWVDQAQPAPRHLLAPALLAVQVDDPPSGYRPWLSTIAHAWTPESLAHIRPAKLVTTSVEGLPPRGIALSSILHSWQAEPVRLSRLQRLPPSLLAVAADDPPRGQRLWLSGVVESWHLAPPPLARAPKLIPAAVERAPTRPPTILAAILHAWEIDTRLPLRPRLAAPPVDPSAVTIWYGTAPDQPIRRPWAAAVWGPRTVGASGLLSVGPGFSAAVPLPIRVIQYQAVAGPFLTVAPLAPDLAVPSSPDVIRRVAFPRWLGITVAPIAPPVVVPAPDLAIVVGETTRSAPSFFLRVQTLGTPIEPPPPAPDLPQGAGVWLSRAAERPTVGPTLFAPPSPPIIPTAAWSIHADPRPRRPIVYQWPFFFAPRNLPADPAVPAPTRGDWAFGGLPPRSARAVPDRLWWVGPLRVPDVTAAVPNLAWRGSFPDRLVRKVPPPPEQFVFAFSAALAGLDPSRFGWRGVGVDWIVHRTASQPPAGLLLSPSPFPVPDLGWAGSFPNRLVPVFRIQGPTTTVDPEPLPNPASPDLAWQGRYPDQFPPRPPLRLSANLLRPEHEIATIPDLVSLVIAPATLSLRVLPTAARTQTISRLFVDIPDLRMDWGVFDLDQAFRQKIPPPSQRFWVAEGDRAISPVDWWGSRPDLAPRLRRAPGRDDLVLPPQGGAITIGEQLRWRPDLPIARRFVLNPSIFSIVSPSGIPPEVPAAREACVEIGEGTLTVPTLLAQTHGSPQLLNGILTVPTLLSPEVC